MAPPDQVTGRLKGGRLRHIFERDGFVSVFDARTQRWNNKPAYTARCRCGRVSKIEMERIDQTSDKPICDACTRISDGIRQGLSQARRRRYDEERRRLQEWNSGAKIPGDQSL